MSNVMTPEQRLCAYLGSVADAVKENNFFGAREDLAALKKVLKGRSDAAATEIQKRFDDIANAIKKHDKEAALARVRAAMNSLDPFLPTET